MKEEVIKIRVVYKKCPRCNGKGKVGNFSKIIKKLQKQKFTSQEIADILGIKQRSMIYYYKNGGSW